MWGDTYQYQTNINRVSPGNRPMREHKPSRIAAIMFPRPRMRTHFDRLYGPLSTHNQSLIRPEKVQYQSNNSPRKALLRSWRWPRCSTYPARYECCECPVFAKPASAKMVSRSFSISHNRWITKLEAGLEPETTVETIKNPPDCVSQNGTTKSEKARC